MYSQSGHRISKTEILISGFLLFLLPFVAFARIEFASLLPNPLGADELGEYIEIRNTGCASMDIGGYHLYDATNKTYIIPAGTNIGSHTNIIFPYRETRISLNNSGSETITLIDTTGMIIDTENYSGTQRDNVVIYLMTTDENCSVVPTTENNTGITNTGTSSTGSTPSSSTGGAVTITDTTITVATNTGTTASGNIDGGSPVPLDPPVGVGSSNGTVDTSIVSTGSILVSVADPGALLTDTGVTASSVIQSDIVVISSGSLSVPDITIPNPGATEVSTATGDIIATVTTPIDPPVSDTQITTVIATDTGTQTPNNSPLTGGLDTTGTGMANRGIVFTYTGITSTGTITIAITHTGATATGILFPEIRATRQEPTNAIFTGGIWDCGSYQPCRINVTFDPIFTGGLLAKNYICEVITATGAFTTCNPNTLYFSTDSSFSFRLTNKLDPSQSRTVNWDVRFRVVQIDSSISAEIDRLIGEIDAGIVDMHTGATSTGVIPDVGTLLLQQSHTGVTFPQIVPTWQNYTNTTHSGDILTCITSPCRVNFTLDPIFTGGLLTKNYACEIRYGTGVYDSCNPPQLYPIGTGSIEITLTHRASGQKETKTLEIIQNITTIVVSIKTPAHITPVDITKDITKPVAIIDFDGKQKSYYEQINDNEFNCYTMTCAVNLTAERSYDPDGGSLRFLWIYGQNEVKTTKDPGAQKYTIGDHIIIFRVIDSAGNYAEIRYIVHVLGPRDKEDQIKVKKIKDPSLAKEKQSSKKKTKKKKLSKMDFFDPPTIALQKSKFSLSGDTYICRTKTKTCSLNLTLSGTEKGIQYTWTYDDGDIITSKNPRSHSFSPGAHEVTVSASYSGSTDILWTQILSVKVEKITKPKKAKKSKKSKVTKTQKSPTLSLIPTAYSSGVPDDDISGSSLPSFVFFLSILSALSYYQRRAYLSKRREQEANSSL